MRRRISLRKDHAGALLLIALGAAVLAMGLGYRMGSLSNMGAGFTPVVLGALLVLVGIAIGATTPIDAPISPRVLKLATKASNTERKAGAHQPLMTAPLGPLACTGG